MRVIQGPVLKNARPIGLELKFRFNTLLLAELHGSGHFFNRKWTVGNTDNSWQPRKICISIVHPCQKCAVLVSESTSISESKANLHV